MTSATQSPDVFWECTRFRSAYMVKRGHGTSQVIFSKEPLNLTNIHNRKQSGLVNPKAVGVHPGPEPRNGVVLITKAPKHGGHPKQEYIKTPLTKTNRKTYKAIASIVAKGGYRADLRADAIARASAVIYSQRQKKDVPEKAKRGKKARSKAAKA